MKYFDYASTTNINPEILENYIQLLHTHFANADSMHQLGRAGSSLMEKSRSQIATLLGVKENEIIFTSGASESNNMAIKGIAFANQKKGKHLITSKGEHSSVLHTFQQLEEVFGFRVTYLNLTKEGIVDVEELQAALSKDTILVSLMHVNNETGAIHPIEEIANLIKSNSKAFFHVDCVQSLGKIRIPFHIIDSASMSAHKIYGLKGSGILYRKSNLSLLPLICGGQQEFHLRGGTSNMLVNIMFAKTLRIALEQQEESYNHCKKLNEYIRCYFSNDEDVVFNSTNMALPHIINISFRQISSEVMLNALDNRGFCVSAYSTCSSKSKAGSMVLKAMGLEKNRMLNAIRISISLHTTQEEVDELLLAIKEILVNYGT